MKNPIKATPAPLPVAAPDIHDRTISDYLDNEYADYSRYVIENRAVPSVIDGFKPIQRKIVHISRQIWKTGNEKSMKVFQLTGQVSSQCLEYDTIVHLANGETIKLGEWAEKYPDLKLDVLCVDENMNVTIALGHSARKTKEVDEIYEIEMEDGGIFRATGNHPVLLTSGIYKNVEDLEETDEIKSILIVKTTTI